MKQIVSGLPERWEDWIGPDETVLWQGAPQPDGRIRLRQVGFALLGLLFFLPGLLVMFLGVQTYVGRDGAPDVGLGLFVILISLPFIGIGLGTMFGPHLAARLAHKRVRYAITNSRIYVATRWYEPTLEAHPLHPDAVVEFIDDGPVGIVSLQWGFRLGSDGDGEAVARYIKLEGLGDARQVFHLLQRLQTEIWNERV